MTYRGFFTKTITIIAAVLLLLVGSSHAQGTTSPKKSFSKRTTILYGQASFYAVKFQGRKTASGEKFNHSKFTAACNMLPLNTWIKITNLKNGKTIIAKVNDRLHAKTKRLVDLTKAGAQQLGFVKAGLARVKVEVIKPQTGK